MAGILKPTGVANLGYEAKLYPKDYKMAEGAPSGLVDGINTDFNRFAVGNYLEFEVKRMCNIYRCGSSQAKYGALKLLKWNGSAFVDVSATHNIAPTNITNTTWQKFIQNLPIGRYRAEYLSAERSDSEWYLEKIKSEKALVITTDGIIKTFSEDNKWVTTSLTLEALTVQNFITTGFDYDKLKASLDKLYVGMVKTQTYETGEELWISDDIDNTMNISAMEYINDDVKPKIELTVPTFVPKDGLNPTDIVLFYSEDTEFAPDILEFSLSSSTTHDASVKMTIKPLYNFNENVKYRYKVNNGTFTEWSSPMDVKMNFSTNIPINMLTIGTNDITIEISNEDGTKVGNHFYSKAITQTNNVPDILIINAQSNDHKVNFIISDADTTDTIEYRITITNSNYSDYELVPWTKLTSNPGDITYNIDTTFVSVDKTNSLTIYYRDNFGSNGSAPYTFTGKYKNILFVDENGEYYTTDKGVILKLLRFGTICSGIVSEPKKVRIKNSYSVAIDNLSLAANILTNNGTTFELSKTNNPFTPRNVLDYGSQVINNGDYIDFYVRANPSEAATGLGEFEIVAQANVYAENV